jgi:hypothetical protein
MIEGYVERLKSALSAKMGEIDQLAALKNLSAHREWGVFVKAINSRVIGHINRLCAIDCGHEESNRIRGQIQTLKDIATIADASEAHIARLLATAQDLRSKLEKLHTRGHLSAEDHAQIAHDIDEQIRNLRVQP